MQSLARRVKPCPSLLRLSSMLVRHVSRVFARAKTGTCPSSTGLKFPVARNCPLLRLYVGVRAFQTLSSSSSNIYALSTAPGRAAIAVVRISGHDCLKVTT